MKHLSQSFSFRFLVAVGIAGMLLLVLAQQNESVQGFGAGKSAGEHPPMVVSVPLARSYDFAGEQIPVASSFDLRERLDRELQIVAYRHSSTLDILKLSGRYFPVFDRILKEYGLPADLKYIAVAESGLRHATSPAGARGIWQFLKSSAEEYGLEVNQEVDERLHVEKATRAACEKLRDLYERFDSWILAAAAYNMGASGLASAIKQQGSRVYFDLNLNEETSRYLFRILAYKDLFARPEAFGYRMSQKELYHPLDDYREIKIKESVLSWAEFAERHKTTYRMLKVYNPWLLSSSLKVSGRKEYVVRVPR